MGNTSGANGFVPLAQPCSRGCRKNKVVVHKADEPYGVSDLPDPGQLPGKDNAEVDLAAASADPAALRHLYHPVMKRILLRLGRAV